MFQQCKYSANLGMNYVLHSRLGCGELTVPGTKLQLCIKYMMKGCLVHLKVRVVKGRLLCVCIILGERAVVGAVATPSLGLGQNPLFRQLFGQTLTSGNFLR